FSGRAQPQAEETFTESLRDDILRGNAEWVPRHIDEELKKHGGDALAVLNEIVIPAIREIGDRYERREIYLPQVIASAEATMKAIDILRPMFPRQSRGRGKILLATVYGDVHDIGKNLVRAMLESYGFEVTDLGKNVPPEKILDALRRDDFLALGLSALMTTTLPSMEKTVRAVREEFPELPIFVGGAAVSPEFTESIGAIYAENAVAAAKLVERLSGE
ncbi:cobalamin-dependent protein, partial [bacterium]|nr:cobalamin-dependent protein [bacterium]